MLKRKDFRLCQINFKENICVPFVIDFIVFDEVSLLERCQHADIERTMQTIGILVLRTISSVIGVKSPVVSSLIK